MIQLNLNDILDFGLNLKRMNIMLVKQNGEDTTLVKKNEGEVKEMTLLRVKALVKQVLCKGRNHLMVGQQANYNKIGVLGILYAGGRLSNA